MLTQDDLKSIKKLLQPIKEDVEVVKSKTSKTDAMVGVMSMTIRDIRDKQSVLNEKVDEGFEKLEQKMDEGFKQTLKYVDEVEKEQSKDKKRITKLEEKLGLSSTT